MEKEIIENLYQNFKKEVLSSADGNEVILKAQDFGFFNWTNYPGIYTDPDIEEKLALNMLPAEVSSGSKGPEHYVYIATRLFEVGGHSRCILHYIDNLQQAAHTVILTDQRKKLPANLNDFFEGHNTPVICLDKASAPISNALSLRQHIRQLNPTRIFLFTHPNDLLPLITFGKFHPCDILLFNHADHTYWIGGSWIDKVVDFRETGLKVTKEGRLQKGATLLRLPVANRYSSSSVGLAKKNIGIDENKPVVGTLTNFHKIQSQTGEVSFVQLLIKWSNAFPGCTFIVIGITEQQFQSLLQGNRELPANLLCLGIVPDPEDHYKAFDFFVEPFPIGSALGIIEACKYGAIPVFSPHPCHLAGSIEAFDESIQALFSQPADFIEFENNLAEMIHKPKEEISQLSGKVKEFIHLHHRGEEWAKKVIEVTKAKDSEREKFSTADIYKEMEYFREYVKKDDNSFFQEIIGMKYLVNRKLMWSMLLGKYKVFQLRKLNTSNWKRIILKTIKH